MEMIRMTDGVDLTIFGAMTVVFIAITLFLGWYGYRNTKNNQEFTQTVIKRRTL